MPRSKKQKKDRAERVSGDNIMYLFIHNIISVFVFFILTIQYGLYDIEKNDSVASFLSLHFWGLVLIVFLYGVIAGLLGRLLAFILLRTYYYYVKKKSMKRFRGLNRGLSKINIGFFLASLFTAIFYMIGFLGILQIELFKEANLLTLMGAYVILKLIVLISVKLLVKF